MVINENVNFSAQVTVIDNGIEKVVMYLGASLDTTNMNINITANTVNEAVTLINANASIVKAQYDEFINKVQSRAKSLGFAIFGGGNNE